MELIMDEDRLDDSLCSSNNGSTLSIIDPNDLTNNKEEIKSIESSDNIFFKHSESNNQQDNKIVCDEKVNNEVTINSNTSNCVKSTRLSFSISRLLSKSSSPPIPATIKQHQSPDPIIPSSISPPLSMSTSSNSSSSSASTHSSHGSELSNCSSNVIMMNEDNYSDNNNHHNNNRIKEEGELIVNNGNQEDEDDDEDKVISSPLMFDKKLLIPSESSIAVKSTSPQPLPPTTTTSTAIIIRRRNYD